MSAAPLLEVEALSVSYTLPGRRLLGARRRVRAVDRASLAIGAGETFGLVGETGCGKSSLSRAIYGLTPIAAGRVRFDGVELTAPAGRDARVRRRGMQMIFQDPGGSLDPRMRIEQIIAEPLEINRLGNRQWRRDKVADVLAAVGLGAGDRRRYPHQLSGGQRQRIAIARAVVVDPALIIADEPVSALDVSLQAQILNLIAALRNALGLALLFVSHDLAVVEYLCDRLAVMYLGRIVETGGAAAVLAAPAHPYTRELVTSSPIPDPRRPIRPAADADEPADPSDPPSGCRYHPRCRHAADRCRVEVPELRVPAGWSESAGGQPMPVDRSDPAGSRARHVACHHAERIA